MLYWGRLPAGAGVLVINISPVSQVRMTFLLYLFQIIILNRFKTTFSEASFNLLGVRCNVGGVRRDHGELFPVILQGRQIEHGSDHPFAVAGINEDLTERADDLTTTGICVIRIAAAAIDTD